MSEDIDYIKSIPCAVIEQAFHDALQYIRLAKRVNLRRYQTRSLIEGKDAYEFLTTKRLPNFCEKWGLDLDSSQIKSRIENMG